MSFVRNALAGVGCLTLLAGGAVAAYQYRVPLGRLVHRAVGPRDGAPLDTVRLTGYPSAAALRSGRGKEAALARTDGPAAVTVTADELAALVEAGLDPAARAALDSLRVTLGPGRFTLRARVRTDRLGREALGPLAGVLDEWESLRMGGPAVVAAAGQVAWRPDEFQVGAVPFPASLVPRVVDALTGGRGGLVPIEVPPTTGAVAIRGDGVTFYRRAD
jgi:hypothetical protein